MKFIPKTYCVLPYEALVAGIREKFPECPEHPDLKEGESYVLVFDPKRLQDVQEDIESHLKREVTSLSIEFEPSFCASLISISSEMEKSLPLFKPMSLNGCILVLMANFDMAVTHEMSDNGYSEDELKKGRPLSAFFGLRKMTDLTGINPSKDLEQIKRPVPVLTGAELKKKLSGRVSAVDNNYLDNLTPSSAYVVVEDGDDLSGVMAVLQSRSEKDLYFLQINPDHKTGLLLLEAPQALLQGIRRELEIAGTPGKYARLFKHDGDESFEEKPRRGFLFRVVKGDKPENG
jgi:hypothetical protein